MEYHDYFGLTDKSQFLGLDELDRACEAERRHILTHAKHWDLKWDEDGKPYLSYRHGNYDVELPVGRDSIATWAFHIAQKTWMHPESVYEFIHVAQAANKT
jgi:hypothetical protein